MDKMEIKICKDTEVNLYTVIVNDQVLLECLSEDDVDRLTIAEIRRLCEANY